MICHDEAMNRSTPLPAAVIGMVRTMSRAASQVVPTVGPLRYKPSAGFYEQAANVGEGDPGEVVASERIAAYLLPGLKLRARSWRILYRSTRHDDSATVVSGSIYVPRNPRGIIGYAPGTHGLANYSAPSRLIARGVEYEAAFVARLLSLGYAVVLTDYEGLGTPGDHPYIMGRILGRNVLDAVRAARSFDEAGLGSDLPLGIIGYSEGGHASAAAAELHASYAPELDIVGIASGSVPSELESAGDHIEGSFFSFFAGYGALGVNCAYPELNLDQYLTPEGEQTLYRLRRTSIVTAALRGPHFMGVHDIMTENVLRRPDWQARLRENSLGSVAPIAPIYLYTAKHDPLVPPAQTRDLAVRWRARGADVRLTIAPGIDHITGYLLGVDGAVTWLDQQMAGARPMRSSVKISA